MFIRQQEYFYTGILCTSVLSNKQDIHIPHIYNYIYNISDMCICYQNVNEM